MPRLTQIILNPPNLISLFRLLLIPAIVLLIRRPEAEAAWRAAGLFIMAGLSDFLDGLLARRQKMMTKIGAFLDPLADKMLTIAILVTLLGQNHPTWLAPVAIIILSREISVSALLGVTGAQGIQLPLPRTHGTRAIFQFLGLFLLLVREQLNPSWHLVGSICIALATFFSVVSAVEYFVAYARQPGSSGVVRIEE